MADAVYNKEVSVRATWLILRAAAQRGVTPPEILAAVGLDQSVIEDHEARISHELEMKIWDVAAARTRDAAFGLHAGELSLPETFGPGGLAAMTSANLGESLERITRYLRLMHTTVEFGFEVREQTAHLSHRLAMPPWIMKRHAAESGAASAICRIRESVGEDVRPVEVRFQHAEPESIAEHQRIFECPLSFGQQRNELVLRTADLALPVRDAHPELCRIFEAQADALLSRIGQDDRFIQDARRAIYDALSAGEVNVKGVAARLGIAPEQLREGLSRRDTSFRAMLSAIRRDLAQIYLEDKQWAMMDIAFVLGFANTSSFNRTFQGWTGMTPAAYRRSLFEQTTAD